MKLKINSKEFDFDGPKDTPLLWALRDYLELKGTKFGCGQGLCGSCTVLMNGAAVRSCVTPLALAVEAEITTIEGLSEKGDHPLQIAWKKYNVPQCGYCQPGQIMNAAGLLIEKSKPSKKEIQTQMAGNICRCGTYQRIEKAILAASGQSHKNDKSDNIGKTGQPGKVKK